MKKILLFVIALLPMLAVAQVAGFNGKYLITNEGVVGIFLKGDKIPTKLVGYAVTKRSESRPEGEEAIIYTFSEDGQKIFDIEDRGFTIDMLIFSAKFKTSKNIGVGSTIEEFVVAYPDARIATNYEDDDIYMRTEQLDVAFLLDYDDLLEEPKFEVYELILKASDFKKGSKIRAIRL